MKLPVISGKEMLKLLAKQGFQIVRQKGDHVSLYKKESGSLVVFPLKNEIKPGTLLSILNQARLSREKLIELIQDL